MTDKEVIKQALELLKQSTEYRSGCAAYIDAVEDVDALLAQPEQEQEPVAWMVMNGVCNYQLCGSKHQADTLCTEMQKRHDLSGSFAAFHVSPLYPTPQPAPALQPLTDELEFALERLVSVCNNFDDLSNIDETIAAEAVLEKLYKSRAAHGIGAPKEDV